MMALLFQTLFLLLCISAISSQRLQNDHTNITNNASAEVCQGNNCNTVYSSPPPPYQSLPIYAPPPPPQGSQPQCPPCCAPPQPYYYPPQPYMTPPPFGYQPYYNNSGVSTCSVFCDGFLLGLCLILLGAFV